MSLQNLLRIPSIDTPNKRAKAKNILIMVLKAQNFQFSTNVALAYNVSTLGEEADLELLNFQFSTNDK